MKKNGTLRHLIHILNHTRALTIITLNESRSLLNIHDNWASKTFVPLVGECVQSNLDMFMPQVTDYLSGILYWSPYLPCGLYGLCFLLYQNFSMEDGLLLSFGIKELKPQA